jgi:hypothetical protein
MKKVITLGALVLVVGAIIGFTAPKAVASLTGYLYGHGLYIESVPGTQVASISNAGALVVTSIVNSGAISATNVTATGFVQLATKTQAQVLASTPSATGQMYFCSDCTVTAVCVSTATNRFAWQGALDPATDCD